MVVEVISVACFILVVLAELVHLRRCRRLRRLAFLGEKPKGWVSVMPWLRSLASGILCWGLLVLLGVASEDSSVQEGQAVGRDHDNSRHVVVILDVSPSMLIEDAGKTGIQKRSERASDVMSSIIDRIVREDVLYSLVAVYTDARPVIVASEDVGVLKNIMELPMEQAFNHGKTDLSKGVEVAFKLAGDWPRDSTTFILLTDGDTVGGDRGFPNAPSSLDQFVIAGFGDKGAFIDGHFSRQDSATMRYMASRFGGAYHDVNIHHLPTSALTDLVFAVEDASDMSWSRKQIAIAAILVGALLLALIPLLLGAFAFNVPKHIKAQRTIEIPRGGVRS